MGHQVPNRERPKCLGKSCLLLVLIACALSAAGQTKGQLELNYHLHLLRPTAHMIEIEIDASKVSSSTLDLEHLPPKVLVVHRFTEDMLTNYRKIKEDPRVQVVIDMDGYGQPGVKKHIYDMIVARRPVQFTGFKLFYQNDHPMMTLREVLALQPVPLYIQYQ